MKSEVSPIISTLTKLPLVIKFFIVVTFVTCAVLLNLVLFVQYAPYANTSSYNSTLSSSKANFLKLPNDKRISFQLINKSKKKKFDADRYTIFFFHGLPGSRHFHHINELEILRKRFNNTQIIRFDRPNFGYASDVVRKGESRLDSVVRDVSKFVKSLKLKEGNFGVIGFGAGTPFAIKFAQKWKIDLVLISPVGKLFQSEEVVEVEENLDVFRKYYYYRSHVHPYVPEFWMKLYSQLGYVCNDLQWYEFLDRELGLFTEEEIQLFGLRPVYEKTDDDDKSVINDIDDDDDNDEEEEEKDLEEEDEKDEEEREEKDVDKKEDEEDEEDEEWGQMLNDTIIEMYRSGIQGIIDELNFLSSEEWNNMDIRKDLKRVKIFYGKKDIISIPSVMDRFFDEIRSRKRNENEEIDLQMVISETHSHFTMFKDYFEEAVEFLRL